jgi:Calx-beta domain/FG-GAP-like repeat
MSFHSWLRKLRSTMVPGRGQRRRDQRNLRRAATHRPGLQALDDRSVPAFLTGVDYTVGWSPSEVRAGDFNGDDIPDLATLNISTNDVSVLMGNGDGTFQPARSSYAGDGYPLASLAVGDFNEDGKLDLATGSNFYDLYGYGIDDVVVLLGHGDGTFAAPRYLGTDLPAQSVVTGDLNGDDHLDLVVVSWDDTSQTGSLSVLLGGGDGTFALASTDPEDGFRPSPALADFDGDGNTDVVLGRELFLGNGDGTLREPSDIGVDAYWGTIVGDFDGDGDFDLAGTNFDRVSVLRGNGDGTFQPAQFFAAGAYPYSINAADVNGDSVLDLVMLTSGSPEGYVTALLGSGDGSFGLPISITLDHGPNSLVVADVNADGLADAAVISSDSSIPFSMTGTLSVLLNDGVWPPDDPPSVRIRDSAVNEFNTDVIFASFTVTLSHTSTTDVTVQYATADLSATAGSDYTASSGTVTIPAGQTYATVTIPVKDDRLGEPTETFAVNLSAPTNATIGDGQGVITIFDNEPRIMIDDVSKAEGRKNRSTFFTFTVTLVSAYDQPVTVSLRTVDGTATTAAGDYVAKSGTLTFAPGETTKTVTIEVKGDNRRESNETFYLDLFGNSANSLLLDGRGVGTIVNDD